MCSEVIFVFITMIITLQKYWLKLYFNTSLRKDNSRVLYHYNI